jgi:hypothetical protein
MQFFLRVFICPAEGGTLTCRLYELVETTMGALSPSYDSIHLCPAHNPTLRGMIRSDRAQRLETERLCKYRGRVAWPQQVCLAK